MKTFDVSTRAEFGATAAVLARLVPRARSCAAGLILVGAAARDVVVTARTNARPARATYDVDVAVAVAGWDSFRCVTDGLERSAVPSTSSSLRASRWTSCPSAASRQRTER